MKNKTKLRIIALISFSLFIMLNNRCKKSDVDLRLPPTTVFDIDGNGYHPVTIGTQVWLRENLKTTKLNDGTPILHMQDENAWGYMSTDAYCWYNNDSIANKNTYGALYNWHTVGTGKLCPLGWHVPTEAEWTTLITSFGGESAAGKILQESGTGDFAAVLGGARALDGGFFSMGLSGYWWSATELDANYVRYIKLVLGDRLVVYGGVNRMLGYSVRCLQDN